MFAKKKIIFLTNYLFIFWKINCIPKFDPSHRHQRKGRVWAMTSDICPFLRVSSHLQDATGGFSEKKFVHRQVKKKMWRKKKFGQRKRSNTVRKYWFHSSENVVFGVSFIRWNSHWYSMGIWWRCGVDRSPSAVGITRRVGKQRGSPSQLIQSYAPCFVLFDFEETTI